MTNRISSIWDAVGNTPLLRIKSLSERTGNEILAKAEFMNPGGSVKDRAAKGIIRSGESSVALTKGATIVEGTAGNTGIGLAVLARERGYKVVVTMPDNQANEKYEYLNALGVDVRKVPVVPFSNPAHFYHQAKVLAEQNSWFWANQFENTANGDFHYETTGSEIWSQTGAKVDYFVTAVGSGGTLSGVSRYLKEKNDKVKVVLADPMGSGLFCQVRQGKLEAEGSSITEGIGIMRITENFRRSNVDEAMRVSDQEMTEMFYHLAQEDGLLVGTSSALNVRAAYEISKKHHNQGLHIVTLLCDHGSRYASKMLNPSFLESKQLKVLPLR